MVNHCPSPKRLCLRRRSSWRTGCAAPSRLPHHVEQPVLARYPLQADGSPAAERELPGALRKLLQQRRHQYLAACRLSGDARRQVDVLPEEVIAVLYPLVLSLSKHERKVLAPLALRPFDSAQDQGEREEMQAQGGRCGCARQTPAGCRWRTGGPAAPTGTPA